MKKILTCAALLLVARSGHADDVAVEKWAHADASARQSVLQLARRAFDAYAMRRETVTVGALSPLLKSRCGVFVSTMRNGAPRSCMGSLYPTQANAALEIVALAAASSGRDKRFAPVRAKELKSLVLMVTFVGTPRAIAESDALRMQPARDALAARVGRSFGVVLPGETDTPQSMMKWARVRAGGRAGARVEWFRLRAVRFVERRESLKLKPI